MPDFAALVWLVVSRTMRNRSSGSEAYVGSATDIALMLLPGISACLPLLRALIGAIAISGSCGSSP